MGGWVVVGRPELRGTGASIAAEYHPWGLLMTTARALLIRSFVAWLYSMKVATAPPFRCRISPGGNMYPAKSKRGCATWHISFGGLGSKLPLCCVLCPYARCHISCVCCIVAFGSAGTSMSQMAQRVWVFLAAGVVVTARGAALRALRHSAAPAHKFILVDSGAGSAQLLSSHYYQVF